MSLKMLGLSADGRLAVPQSTGDVKSWDTYFAPDDDIHGVIVAGLTQAAQKGAECHSSQYGFTDQDIADLFVKLAKSAHQILHTKAIAVLYADGTGWTVTGSFNLSASAEQQFNIVDIVGSRSRAELFANRIDAMFDWVKTNEPQNLP